MVSPVQSTRSIKKILIANRGEIAVRIIRTCRDMGIKTVAVHSDADHDAMHARLADESVCIGPAQSRYSYLNIPAVLAAAEVTGADAIHPGYGFLAENAEFADLVTQHGMIFIGPSSAHMRTMGQKMEAKKTAKDLGFQLIPGSGAEIDSAEEAEHIADKIGYPVLLKATAGGGGKGMAVVRERSALKDAFVCASAEAKASFGHGGMYMEKYLDSPRHIEFQVLGDCHGNVVCLGERECSVQRNYQKIWEEAPSAALTSDQRSDMINRVVKAMQTLKYVSAGTIEFLYADGEFYFIEMNTRIQVEHPVTEMVTGIDIVKQQILIAQGYPLAFEQKDIVINGHAIECRINAENPDNFIPSPGKVKDFLPACGPFVRLDSALFSGYAVPQYYDSLVAKVIAHGGDRTECVARMRRALGEMFVSGIDTLIPLHQALCDNDDIIHNNVHVKWLENVFFKSGENTLKKMVG